jgi:hypothetical protein
MLFGFGTPLLFRTSSLNHNQFVMYWMFLAFVYLWMPRTSNGAPSLASRLAAGFFGGLTLATDYVGVIVLPLLYGYFVVSRRRAGAAWSTVLRESLALVAGALPPIAFLLYSQWAMYGNPFIPGQVWMPNQNIYVNEGARGWTLPDPQLFVMNLFDPSFGLYTWAPLLLLALVPAWRYAENSLVLPRFERRWLAVTWVVFLLFASANQYSRLQFTSGFRYLLPLVPFLMLALADHWIRLPTLWRYVIGAGVVLNSWVLTVFREPVGVSWKMFFDEGPQLPRYRVLSLTASPDSRWLGTWWVPAALIAITVALAAGIWRYGARLEQKHVLS